jgi:hypothetical protein
MNFFFVIWLSHYPPILFSFMFSYWKLYQK